MTRAQSDVSQRKVVNTKRFDRTRQRLRDELNPCSGRTTAERQRITRYLVRIGDEIHYHLERLNEQGHQPLWLPEAVITPNAEADYIESQERFDGTTKDEYGFITDMRIPGQRASNRLRVAGWYTNPDGDLYMTAMIMVSPLPCERWGALPLTLGQWRIITPELITAHLHWKWVHAVRKYWHDDRWQVGGIYGWYMERAKKLEKDHSELWTGQAIYAPVVRQFLDHAPKT